MCIRDRDECSSSRNSDIITYSVEFSWEFLIAELASYIFLLFVFLSLMTIRISRKRRERKANRIRKSKDIDDAKLERLMENEFGRISGNVALLDETELEELIEIESDGD